jgi:hypothetical protein
MDIIVGVPGTEGMTPKQDKKKTATQDKQKNKAKPVKTSKKK